MFLIKEDHRSCSKFIIVHCKYNNNLKVFPFFFRLVNEVGIFFSGGPGFFFTSFSNLVPCSSSRGYPSIRKHFVSEIFFFIASHISCKTSSYNKNTYIALNLFSRYFFQYLLPHSCSHCQIPTFLRWNTPAKSLSN